jgi:hypothetical protein
LGAAFWKHAPTGESVHGRDHRLATGRTFCAVTWDVGRTEAEATTVDVRFQPDANGPRLVLTHSGFDILREQNRKGYNGGRKGALEIAFLEHRRTNLAEAV